MAVFRVNKNRDYTCMSNVHLRDKRITLKAKGLLSVMLSLPDDWDYSINGLTAISRENETAIRTALAELEKCGYLMRTEIHDAGTGKFGYIYDIYETAEKSPHIENPHTDNPHTDNPHTGLPYTENRTQLNTKSQSTNKRSTEGQNTHPAALDAIGNTELRETIEEFLKFRRSIKKPMGEHAVGLLIKKLDGMARTDEEKMGILNQSIMNGWQGLYPLERGRDGRTRFDAYKGTTGGKYQPVGSGETVI